jgi:predicted Na+-dependent transporter
MENKISNWVNYKNIFGFGVLIYLVIFLIMSGFAAYDMRDTLTAKIITLAAIALVAFWGGKSLNPANMAEALKHSIGWVVIIVVLDALITARFTGFGIFSQWNVLLGYVLVVLTPLLAIAKAKEAPQTQTPPSPKPPSEPEPPSENA